MFDKLYKDPDQKSRAVRWIGYLHKIGMYETADIIFEGTQFHKR